MVMWTTMRKHPCHIAPALLWAAGVWEKGGSARPVAGGPPRRDPGAAGPQRRWCDLTLYTWVYCTCDDICRPHADRPSDYGVALFKTSRHALSSPQGVVQMPLKKEEDLLTNDFLRNVLAGLAGPARTHSHVTLRGLIKP